jgi:predicted TIM-barrel fold metal-dependent hydrolase
MLDQTVLFISAEPALAHRYHDNPKNRLSGTAPFIITSSGHNWDPAVRFVEEVVGEDRLMFAIDYPYANCNQQVAQAAAIELANPKKFYHLNAKKVFKL